MRIGSGNEQSHQNHFIHRPHQNVENQRDAGKEKWCSAIKCSGTEVIFLRILLLMGNYDKGNFILIEPMSRFPFQLLLTDTSAAENVPPKLYNPLHKNQDNGKNWRCQRFLLSEGSCAKKGLDFEKKALSSLSTCSVVLVPLVKAETQGRCCSAFKKNTLVTWHTLRCTRGRTPWNSQSWRPRRLFSTL